MRNFSKWIRELNESVIQDEFGYEEGEFTVFPDHWRQLFLEGLTPRQAWQRALDGFANAREEKERKKIENWNRIQNTERAR